MRINKQLERMNFRVFFFLLNCNEFKLYNQNTTIQFIFKYNAHLIESSCKIEIEKEGKKRTMLMTDATSTV